MMSPSHFVCQYLVIAWLLVACGVSHNAPTSTAQAENLPSYAENFPLHLGWTYETRDPIVLPPRYAQGVVLVQTYAPRGDHDATHFAINATDGQLKWNYETPNIQGAYPYSWGTAQGNLILAGSDVEAIDLTTGQQVWHYPSGAIWSIAISDNAIYVAARGELIALDGRSGQANWRNTSLPGYGFQVFYNPLTNHVIVPDEQLYILDAQTGTNMALIETNIYEAAESRCNSPVDNFRFESGRIYCLALAFDAESGQSLSTATFDGMANKWFPLITSNTMYLNSLSGSLKAIDLTTFSLKWEYQAKNQLQNVPLISNVAIVGTTGYSIANDATIRAFDLADGHEIGRWQAPSVVDWRDAAGSFSPLAGVESDGQQLYATFGTNVLYAFKP